jgi:predicted Zn-dependent protease
LLNGIGRPLLKESQQSLDVDAFIERANVLWGEVAQRTNRGRVELYAKTSRRLRVARDLTGREVTINSAHESGLAVRTSRPGQDRSGFAASSGFSEDAARWVASVANDSEVLVTAAAPGPEHSIASQRRDLDEDVPLPTSEALTTCVMANPGAEWVEAAVTLEVLVGAEGWIAARRRNRLWALAGDGRPYLLAQRGFEAWEQLVNRREGPTSLGTHPKSPGWTELVLQPDAAGIVVAALVESFHLDSASEWVEAGKGWSVADEPLNPNGLAGGSFDDVGFPAAPRVLASDGLWVGSLGGPGTFRRSSFREPPSESVSNLMVPEGTIKSSPGLVARRCRLLRLSTNLWVLELDLPEGPFWIRTNPRQLLAGCRYRMGGARLTPAGPIVPAIVFEGLQLQ